MRAGETILVAGHAAVDEIFDSPGAKAARIELGGAVCYSSICLRSLGIRPVTFTRVGSDFPNEYNSLLNKLADIDLRRCISKHRMTTRFRIIRNGDQRDLYLLRKCDNLNSEDLESEYPKIFKNRPSAAIVNGIAGEIGSNFISSLLNRKMKVFVDSQTLTRSFDENTGKVNLCRGEVNLDRLRGVIAIKVDDDELAALTGSANRQLSIEKVCRYVDNIVVTSGNRETELYQKGELKYRARPLRVKCLDTTGAGDIMLACFASYYLWSKDVEASLYFATLASSIATKTVGIKKAVFSRNKVEKIIDLVRIPRMTIVHA